MEEIIMIILFLCAGFFFAAWRTELANSKYFQKEYEKEKHMARELLKRTEIKL